MRHLFVNVFLVGNVSDDVGRSEELLGIHVGNLSSCVGCKTRYDKIMTYLCLPILTHRIRPPWPLLLQRDPMNPDPDQ